MLADASFKMFHYQQVHSSSSWANIVIKKNHFFHHGLALTRRKLIDSERLLFCIYRHAEKKSQSRLARESFAKKKIDIRFSQGFSDNKIVFCNFCFDQKERKISFSSRSPVVAILDWHSFGCWLTAQELNTHSVTSKWNSNKRNEGEGRGTEAQKSCMLTITL